MGEPAFYLAQLRDRGREHGPGAEGVIREIVLRQVQLRAFGAEMLSQP
jgi:hypothetical protein